MSLTSEFPIAIGEYLRIDRFSSLYEVMLRGPDNKAYLPDFTIEWRGQTYYWEHPSMLNKPAYQRKWKEKKAWYAEHFPGQLLTTQETSTLSEETKMIIASRFGVEPIDVEIEL